MNKISFIPIRQVLWTLFFCMVVGLGTATVASAQVEEPEVISLPEPRTPHGEGRFNSLGFNFFINNFGFGLGGQYARSIGPMTELTFSTGITGIRDVSEQNFQDFITGQQVIPNKYNRALSFPFMLGLKKRIFARQVDDNFRLFLSASGGPVLAFLYPYFNDVNNSGYRDVHPDLVEPLYDFFTGWKDGHSEWGVTGEFKIGVDIGDNFTNLTTVEFGFLFYYFKQGLQIMEPFQPAGVRSCTLNPELPCPVPVDEDGNRNSFFSAQRYFGTPHISLIFGSLW